MSNWQEELAQGFSQAKDLLNFLELDPAFASDCAERAFKTRVPLGFAQRMEKRRFDDPLLRQVLAVAAEEKILPGYTTDPLQEQAYNPLPGLIHKYSNRVLLSLSGTCAVNCRYCFRRHFPYHENRPGKQGLAAIVAYIQNHPEVNEVILSGGDPLLLNNHYFAYLLDALLACSSIQTLRIHTRVPVVLPSRLESQWLALMNQYPWHRVMVLHTNHPHELDESVAVATRALNQHGWTLLNQSVLLAGVNDDVSTLVALSQRLFDFKILPYYLHVLDPVQGAAHFDLPMQKIETLYRDLQTHLSGYLLPRLVREEAGKLHKTLIRF